MILTGGHYHVSVHNEDDLYWASVEELPGCFASGGTFEELMEALEEAVGLYLADDPDAATTINVDPKPRLQR